MKKDERQFEDSESAHTVGADSRVLMTVGGWLGAAIPPDSPIIGLPD